MVEAHGSVTRLNSGHGESNRSLFSATVDISGIIIKKAPVYKKAPPYLSKISNEIVQKQGFW